MSRRVPKGELGSERGCNEVKPIPVVRRVKKKPGPKAESGEYLRCEHCGFASPREVILRRHITNVHGNFVAQEGEEKGENHDNSDISGNRDERDGKSFRECTTEEFPKVTTAEFLSNGVFVVKVQDSTQDEEIGDDEYY